jgi:hypothetical protein
MILARTINLTALGVSADEQSRLPDIYSMPNACNPANEKIWRMAVSNLKTKSANAAWQQALSKYMQLCSRYSLHPFMDRGTNNDKAYDQLKQDRRDLVKFLERNCILDLVKLRPTTYKVSIIEHGFVIKAEAPADLLVDEEELLKPNGNLDSMGLRKNSISGGALWEITVNRGVRFFIANSGANLKARWSIGYEIVVPVFPQARGNNASSNKELESFVINAMWLPLVRGIRPVHSMIKF